MENESLIVGNSNWAVKANSLLGYAVGEASGKYVPREFTFTRNSTATYTDENGIIQTAAANIARVQNNALLLEPQRTNLFPNSQTTANWGFTNMSRTANYGISPDGTQNADLLFPTTSGSVAFSSDNTTSSLVIGQPFVVSFFIKLNASFISNVGTNILDIRLAGAAVWSRPTVRINLETGEVTAVNNASYISSTNFGNGWFRITFGATPTATSAAVGLQFPTGVTMDGGSFYIWGLQGEANATYATSYIPTTSSSATRVADFATTNNISTLFGSTEGSFFVDMTYDNGGASGSIPVFLRSSISSSYLYATYLQSQSGVIQLQVNNSGSASAAITSSAIFTQGQRVKIAVGYKQNDFVLYVNGSLIGTDISGDISSSLAFIDLGTYSLSASTFQYNGTISESVLFPTRLTNAELQALTTL